MRLVGFNCGMPTRLSKNPVASRHRDSPQRLWPVSCIFLLVVFDVDENAAHFLLPFFLNY